MTVTISFPAEIERQLQLRAAAAGLNVERFIADAVQDRLTADEPLAPPRRSKAEFRQRLQEWIALHPSGTHFVDDSRESIYAGRGE